MRKYGIDVWLVVIAALCVWHVAVFVLLALMR